MNSTLVINFLEIKSNLENLSEEIIASIKSWLSYFSENNSNNTDSLIQYHDDYLSNYIWEGKTILIAEDEEANFLFLKAALSKTKAKILWARNGKEALNIINSNEKVDLILMDIKMPEMNGIEASTKIKQINNNIPIIAQTAYASEEDIEKYVEAGCSDCLPKPFTKEKLLKIISRYI